MLWFKAHFSRLPKYLSSLRKFKLPCPGTALSLCPFVRSLWNIKGTCFIRSLWFSLVLVWTVFKFIFRKRRSYFSGTFYNGRTLRLISGRPWVAVIHKTSKTAPQSSPKAGKILEKSSWNRWNPQNSSPTTAKQPEKFRKKVAETAEITKTAPQPSPKSGKDQGKSSWNH